MRALNSHLRWHQFDSGHFLTANDDGSLNNKNLSTKSLAPPTFFFGELSRNIGHLRYDGLNNGEGRFRLIP